MTRRHLFSALLCSLMTAAGASADNTFGIIVDSATYSACRDELDAYRDVLHGEGLDAVIVSGTWAKPTEVKAEILKLGSRRHPLEGIVLVGDIPIAMVREGQHLTTAFKMNEQRFPPEESSVPSDRFYDDFALEFEEIGPDTTCAGRYFYRLSEKGSQSLRPDIYSARMRVPGAMLAGQPADFKYELMRRYLRKVVKAHREDNPLDRITYFMGSAYNSDDLNVWRNKALEYREYFPAAFRRGSGNTFLTFREDPEMKWRLYTELQRPGCDIFQFSEHGAYDTQYINAYGGGTDLESSLYLLKSATARQYRKWRGTSDDEPFKHELLDSVFHLRREVLSDSALVYYRMRDSITSRNANIDQMELLGVKSNPRFVILNACYNGSFHNPEGYIAGMHVFGEGDCIVAQGNTVNVLQDKMEDKLIGLLSLGIRVGEWQREVPYLESHLIGDPTYRFVPQDDDARMDRLQDDLVRRSLDVRTWKKYLQSGDPILRAAAITHLGYAAQQGKQARQTSDKALDLLRNDDSRIVRVCALDVLRSLADSNAEGAIVLALNDPYEAIVRYGCIFAQEYGSAGENGEVLSALEGVLDRHSDLRRAQDQAETAVMLISGHEHLDEEIATLRDTTASVSHRIYAARTFRNYMTPLAKDALLEVAEDPGADPQLREVACEALGWYRHSSVRDDISKSLALALRQGKDLPPEVSREMEKTIVRLSCTF